MFKTTTTCCVLLILGSLSGSLAQIRFSRFCSALTDEIPAHIWKYESFGGAYAKLGDHLEQPDPVRSVRVALETGWLLGIDDMMATSMYTFTQLSLVLGDRGCESFGYEILMKNIVAIECRSHMKPRRRQIDQTVYDFARERAEMCQPRYQAMFEEQYAKLSNDTKEIVSVLFGPEIEKKLLDRLSPKRSSILNVGLDASVVDLVPFEDITSQVRTFLEPSEPQEPEKKASKFKLVFRRAKVQVAAAPQKLDPEEVDKYVTEPCRTFKDILGDVFKSARLDMYSAREKELKRIPEDSFGASELFKSAWHDFRMCELLLSVDGEALKERFNHQVA